MVISEPCCSDCHVAAMLTEHFWSTLCVMFLFLFFLIMLMECPIIKITVFLRFPTKMKTNYIPVLWSGLFCFLIKCNSGKDKTTKTQSVTQRVTWLLGSCVVELMIPSRGLGCRWIFFFAYQRKCSSHLPEQQ